MSAPWKDKKLVAAMACISVAATCMIGGYEFVRSTAASMFLDAFGSRAMPYAMTVVPAAMFLLIYSYGRTLTRLGSLLTLQASLALSALTFLACYAALRAGFKPAVAVLYVFTEAYIVILVEQFWSFIDSTLDPAGAKVFNGPICGGASIGPILAGLLVKSYARQIGSEQFVLLSALSLLPAAALSYAAYRLAGEPTPSERAPHRGLDALSLRLVAHTRVLLLIGCVITLTQVFATVSSLRFYQILEAAIPLKDERSAYLGGFWGIKTNSLAMVLQFVITPLLLRRLPLKAVLVGMPALHIATSLWLLASPSLASASLCLMLFKGIDYSVFRAAKETLYIPLSYDARYRAKQVVDAFNYRFSKGATAGLVSLVQTGLGALPGWAYPAAALAAAGSWLAAAFPLSAEAERSQAGAL